MLLSPHTFVTPVTHDTAGIGGKQVYGHLARANETAGKERFTLKLAIADVHWPTEKYSPTGVYMSFEHYEVERRTHLKCISATEGRSCCVIVIITICKSGCLSVRLRVCLSVYSVRVRSDV